MPISDTIVSFPPAPDNTHDEVWLPIPDYEGVYDVSDRGRVRRVETGRILRGAINRGYPFLILCANGIRTNKKIHWLVASAFIGKRPEGADINHIDGNKSNNHVTNLEYVSHRENMHHAVATGLFDEKALDFDIQQAVSDILKSNPDVSVNEVARQFNISHAAVMSIGRANKLIHKMRGLKPVRVRFSRAHKLDENAIQAILSLLAEGNMLQKDIAAKFDVHESTISLIKKRTYRSVLMPQSEATRNEN